MYACRRLGSHHGRPQPARRDVRAGPASARRDLRGEGRDPGAALDADGIVVDIGLLRTVLRETLAPLDYQNLDEVPALAGENTTTEFLCHWIHGALGQRLGPRPEASCR